MAIQNSVISSCKSLGVALGVSLLLSVSGVQMAQANSHGGTAGKQAHGGYKIADNHEAAAGDAATTEAAKCAEGDAECAKKAEEHSGEHSEHHE